MLYIYIQIYFKIVFICFFIYKIYLYPLLSEKLLILECICHSAGLFLLNERNNVIQNYTKLYKYKNTKMCIVKYPILFSV